MNLEEIYNKLPKDLIDYKKFLKLFDDIKDKELNNKKQELIIKIRVYKILINSKYRTQFINYLVENIKPNDLSNINGFFGIVDNTIDYENNSITINDIIKLLNNNSKFYDIAKNIYNHNKNKIKKYGLSKITNNNFLKLTIESYLLINDIEYDDNLIDNALYNNIGEVAYSDDAFEQYVNEINKYPRLTKEEEKDLITKAQNGDLEARNKFLEGNLKLVVYIVRKKYSESGLPMLDLVNEGNIGLMKAIEKYKVDLGVKFSGYASFWIEHNIKKALHTQTRNIALPNYMINRIFNYNKHFKALEEKLGRKPTNEELMKSTGYSRDTINLVKQYLHDTISENELLKSNSDEDSVQTLLDCIEDSNSNLEEEIFKKNEYTILNYVLNSNHLSEKEKDVLKRRYGYYGKPEKLEEIGKIYNLTRERIRQIENRALLKLKKELLKTKYDGITNYKLQSLYSFFPNVEHSQIDYIVEHLSKEYRLLLNKAYKNNYNMISEEILSKQELNTIYKEIIPKIREFLTIVLEEEQEISKDIIRDVIYIINIYDIRDKFFPITKESLTTGLLKEGYIDDKNYNIKTIAKVINKDIFETYEEYLNFVNFMKDKEELSKNTKERIKKFIKI